MSKLQVGTSYMLQNGGKLTVTEGRPDSVQESIRADTSARLQVGISYLLQNGCKLTVVTEHHVSSTGRWEGGKIFVCSIEGLPRDISYSEDGTPGHFESRMGKLFFDKAVNSDFRVRNWGEGLWVWKEECKTIGHLMYLQDQGCAAAVFTPEELGGSSTEEVEDRMIAAGKDYLGSDDDDEEEY